MSNAIQAIPPLEQIQDPAAQQALRALASGWNLRNGFNEEYRWLTKADVTAIVKKLLPEPAQATSNTRDFSSAAPAAASAPNLLLKENVWRAKNSYDQPTPATEQAPNCHLLLAQGGLGKWTFRLGHRPIPLYTGGPLGGNTEGDLVIEQPGGGGFLQGIFARFQSFANGGALSFLDRTTATRRFKPAIQLHDNMHISWEATKTVKTWFDLVAARWVVSFNERERFAVNNDLNNPFCLYVNGAPMTGRAVKYVRSDGLEIDVDYALHEHGVRINNTDARVAAIEARLTAIENRLTAAGL